MSTVILFAAPWTFLCIRLDCSVKEWRLRHFRLAAHRHDVLDSVHLPDVPADDLGELKQGLRRPIQCLC